MIKYHLPGWSVTYKEFSDWLDMIGKPLNDPNPILRSGGEEVYLLTANLEEEDLVAFKLRFKL